MLIDASYFYGDLVIAQTSQPAVLASLNRFINQYEQKYLQAMLGYAMYKEFQLGLLANPIDQKWIDLLYGAEYTNQFGVADKWKGFLMLLDGGVTPSISSNPVSVIVGRGNTYDPISTQNTTVIPPEFVGANFVFMQRGFGPLRSDEFTIAGNVLTLNNSVTFTQGDTFFYFGTGNLIVNTGNADKQSPIANYVYYWYLRHNATTTAGGGEASNNVTLPTSPADKMARAWNQMVEWNRELVNFLYSNNLTYGFDINGLFFYAGSWRYGFLRTEAQKATLNLLTPISTLGF